MNEKVRLGSGLGLRGMIWMVCFVYGSRVFYFSLPFFNVMRCDMSGCLEYVVTSVTSYTTPFNILENLSAGIIWSFNTLPHH